MGSASDVENVPTGVRILLLQVCGVRSLVDCVHRQVRSEYHNLRHPVPLTNDEGLTGSDKGRAWKGDRKRTRNDRAQTPAAEEH